LERSGAPPLLDSTIAERILLGFQVRPDLLRPRLPAPWQVTATPAGANLVVIYNEVLLNQDASGQAAPDATNRYVGIVVPARQPQTGEEASLNLRIFTVHPDSLPGKYRTAQPVAIRREQVLTGDGLTAVVSEQFTVSVAPEGEISLRLRYRRGPFVHVPSRSRARSALDPGILRVYHTDQLAYTVRDASRGVDHVLDLEFRATVAELREFFDGSERLASITVSPWYFRQVYAG
jgi:hypothetical protein